MGAGLNKVAKDIDRKLKIEMGKSEESKQKALDKKKAFYYAKLLNKNKSCGKL